MHLFLVALLFFEPTLHGTHASLKEQNDEADRLGLPRIHTIIELKTFIAQHILIPIVPTETYSLDVKIGSMAPEHQRPFYHYAFPIVKSFLDTELTPIHARTKAKFSLVGFVRDEVYQLLLVSGGNKNAAKGDSMDTRSTHPTGHTVDISWLNLDHESIKELEARLLTLKSLGYIHATKEHWNACYHVVVFPAYANAPPPTKI